MKTKTMKIMSILLAMIMLVTMFGAFAITASAATYSGMTNEVITELSESDIEALKSDIAKLEAEIDNLKKQLADNSTLSELQLMQIAVSHIRSEVDALEAASDDYKDADTTLKQELTEAIAEAKQTVIDADKTLVDAAKTELQEAIDKKADTETVNAAIENLQTAIDALEEVKDNYVTADTALKQELTEAIATAKQETIAATKTLVDAAKTELQEAIDKKADTETVNAAIANLQTAIDTVDAVSGALESTKTELELAIKNGDTELGEKITALNAALNNAISAYQDADTALKSELLTKIDEADATLEAAIKAVQKNLDDAKAELNKAITDGDTELDSEIAQLNTTLIIVAIAAGVGVCGNIALLAWIIIDKHKKTIV